MKKEENIVFAKGMCFAKIFIFFIIGCVFGTYYEEILHFITHKEWSNRQAMIFGPFNPIYGIPAVIYILLLAKNYKKRSIIKTYIYSVLIGGVSEYIISFLGELLFKVKFWDYTGYFLNINGRTTIPFMLFWGVLGVILIKVLYPSISKLIEKAPYKPAQAIYIATLVFMFFDVSITYGAFERMALRNDGKDAYTFIGKFYDDVFTNEYMYNKFPAMAQNSNNIKY
jgi:uncharacterized membrane protein